MRHLVATYPSLARLQVLGTTHEGRPIMGLTIGTQKEESPSGSWADVRRWKLPTGKLRRFGGAARQTAEPGEKVGFVIAAEMHAREVSSVSRTPLFFFSQLLLLPHSSSQPPSPSTLQRVSSPPPPPPQDQAKQTCSPRSTLPSFRLATPMAMRMRGSTNDCGARIASPVRWVVMGWILPLAL